LLLDQSDIKLEACTTPKDTTPTPILPRQSNSRTNLINQKRQELARKQNLKTGKKKEKQ
jgi:hypothetical protein